MRPTHPLASLGSALLLIGGETVEATGQRKGRERLIIKAEGERGKTTETWELIPDAKQLWVTMKTESDGRRPSFEFRRVFERTETAPLESEMRVGDVESLESGEPTSPF